MLSDSVEIAIRYATTEDIEEMLPLLRELFSIENDFQFDEGRARRGLRLLLREGEAGVVLVAETARRVVGMCTLQVLISTAEGGLVGLVEDVVVHPDYRRHAIGKRLLAGLEQWARGRGLTRLQLLYDLDNCDALPFYSALGWRETRLAALRKVPGG